MQEQTPLLKEFPKLSIFMVRWSCSASAYVQGKQCAIQNGMDL
jgi:hypothetical protein